MDLEKMLEFLYGEREKLERVITALEDLQQSGGGIIPDFLKIKSRRGRKSMGADERQDVSDRMKKYWASRRAAAASVSLPREEAH